MIEAEIFLGTRFLARPSPFFGRDCEAQVRRTRPTPTCRGCQFDDHFFCGITQQQFASVLRGLAAHKMIEQMPTGELILAPAGEGLTHSKEFYAAFAGGADYSIRHDNQTLGKMPVESVPPEGEHLLLNGRRWQVLMIDPRAMIVEVIPARGRKQPVFLGSGGQVHRRIVEGMRSQLEGNSTPAYLHPDAAKLLEGARTYANKFEIMDRPGWKVSETAWCFRGPGPRGWKL